jgi:transmembrane sensor
MTPRDQLEADEQAQARAWLVRVRSGKMTQDDVHAFRQWCADHPEMARKLRHTWTALRTAAVDIAQEKTQSGHALNDRARAMRTGRRAFVGFAVAAGASWLALRPPLHLWPAIGEMGADYRTRTGEGRQLTLSNRVTVTMNTRTRIDMLGDQTARHGIDLLAGEADIVASLPVMGGGAFRPIEVIAGRGRLRAEVARFDVRHDDGQVCVTCVSGALTLEHPQRRLVLSSAQQVSYDDRGVGAVSQVNPMVVTAWRRGLLVFDDMPVAQVVDEINRYRPGQVILRNAQLGRHRVQAQIPIARLDDVIELFGKLYGAHITKLPGDIVLLS